MWKNLLFASVALLAAGVLAPAQAPTPVGQIVGGAAQYRSTVNGSVKVTTGLTYQLVLAGIQGTSTSRQSLTIENNQASGSDVCYLIVASVPVITSAVTTTSTNVTVAGATITAAQASIVLVPGGSYTRYWPYVPTDPIYGTCATTGDSIYVDSQ